MDKIEKKLKNDLKIQELILKDYQKKVNEAREILEAYRQLNTRIPK